MSDGARSRMVEQIAQFGAKCRVPPSTVYMTGAHDPRPSEVREAGWVLTTILSDLDGLAEQVDGTAMCRALERAGKLVSVVVPPSDPGSYSTSMIHSAWVPSWRIGRPIAAPNEAGVPSLIEGDGR